MGWHDIEKPLLLLLMIAVTVAAIVAAWTNQEGDPRG